MVSTVPVVDWPWAKKTAVTAREIVNVFATEITRTRGSPIVSSKNDILATQRILNIDTKVCKVTLVKYLIS
jgi:hypothetical protein